MSRLDRLKEQIGWLKALFLILIVTDISMIGWLAVNYRKAETALIVGAIIGILSVAWIAGCLQRTAYRFFKELEKL